MIKITNIETFGWETAVRGMRNPMNSWEKSDSCWCLEDACRWDCENVSTTMPTLGFCIGPNDLELMLRLAKSGSDHAKFRRMINVTMDILAPLYWWKEFDTYKVGTVANSTSTMHKIHAKEFTSNDFSHEHLFDSSTSDDTDCYVEWGLEIIEPIDILLMTVNLLNKTRFLYLDYAKRAEMGDQFAKEHLKECWWQMIQLLPSSYNQLRTVQVNYEVLATIYKSRKDHKLDEWREFCKMIKELPYSEIITLEE